MEPGTSTTSRNRNDLPADLSAKRVLNAAQAASYLSYSVWHLRKLCREGRGPQKIRLSDHRYGWQIADLDAWLAEKRAAA
jgi:predicted DNA-binding transcriptional regulator AlpA